MRSRDDAPHPLTTRDPDRRPTHAAGDGELPSWWTSLDRRRLAVALGSTFVAVPVVVLDNLPQHRSAQAEAEEVAVVADPTTTTTTATTLPPPSSTTVTVESTTTTTAAPTTTATTAAPTTTTTAAPTTTTATTASPAPTTTATTAPPAPVNEESGGATWYRYRTGECAHRTLPRGTVVTITNVANGRTATCTVTDRGPYGAGRIIDLDDETFAQLAPLSAGVIDVTIRW